MKNSSNLIEKEFKDLRKKLLDLTLRNQLLNFKARAKTLNITNQTTTNVFQTLVINNKKMYFAAGKKAEDEKSKFPFKNPFSKFIEGDVKLETSLTPNELQKRLFYINNQAKTMLQEQGYNILYLACGFLEWYDNSKPRQKNLAPLILIPVSMERKSVGKSFNLYWTGEDLQTNISLKAKLKENDIELPDFEFKKYGEVIEDYIRKVNDAISHVDKWKVNMDISLGFFSFTKFIMYNDLNPDSWDSDVDLTKNELIEAIFNPTKNTHESFNENDIDKELSYENMYQVLDADSSQIAAIQDVKLGHNLVVEGPPGTGKSQTIVNLIAELLAEGKSVLFVSEKMAALDVVKDRLTNVGLGKFVLELHSHKTRRKKLLKELQKATNVRYQDDLNIDQTIRKLNTLRSQLDNYANVIHEPLFNVNLSAFNLYGLKESADDHFNKKGTLMPLVRFSNPESLTMKDIDDIILNLENLAELYQTISRENPWSNCAPKSLLPADLREIEQLINDTLYSLDNFLIERERIYESFGIKKPDTLNEFEQTLTIFDMFSSDKISLIDGDVLRYNAFDYHEARELIDKLSKYQKSNSVLKKFNNNIYQVDINNLLGQITQLQNKKFSIFKKKHNTELVEPYYATSVPSINNVISDLKNLQIVLEMKKDLDSENNNGIKCFGQAWHLNADIKDLESIVKWMVNFNSLKDSGMISNKTIDFFSQDLFEFKPEQNLNSYLESGKIFKNELSRLKSKLNPRSKLIFKKETGDVSLEDWSKQLNKWRGQLSSLHLWSQYLNAKELCKGSESEKFIEAIEKRNIEKWDVKPLVKGNFADALLNIIFMENPSLVSFIGELHENRIQEFKDLDKQILILNRKRIYQKLNNNIPKIFGATEDPEAKILAGEFTRKSGHLPVRKLLEKAGGTIKQIKPCFMMSPLSVAQYLDPTNEKLRFDVVIFDEASQVKPEDALGAFMRGKTAVVMGDTQQLPPTSFFEQMASQESFEEEATSLDMESILHLCKLSFPVKMLKWHYRSRHESLIAVSNTQFYDDELLVYPSPSHSDSELGLKFHYNPNTAYSRGGGSANHLEAKDVVAEIFNHFDKYGDTKSLGVGTFSVAQKNAILEELEIERKNRPELEPLFSENKDERFFVKNLETIQGDERDVILISVGYGFDESRKMSLNFGPLNQDGGERRLNVLITRAREKCVVFSNFKAYDMHLTANPPFGVKALKEFLEYAENLTLGTLVREDNIKEPFEDAIANFLKENGYEVDKHIGCAGFRVDLAIKDPEFPGKYFLGITTDGKMYASSKVARDRDRLREQVLNGLGWKLYHLWSTDWYRNRDLSRNKLLNEVSKALTESHEEEKRRSEEEKKLIEKRKKEAEAKAEELRLAKEKEEAEAKAEELRLAKEKEEAEKREKELAINEDDYGNLVNDMNAVSASSLDEETDSVNNVSSFSDSNEEYGDIDDKPYIETESDVDNDFIEGSNKDDNLFELDDNSDDLEESINNINEIDNNEDLLNSDVNDFIDETKNDDGLSESTEKDSLFTRAVKLFKKSEEEKDLEKSDDVDVIVDNGGVNSDLDDSDDGVIVDDGDINSDLDDSDVDVIVDDGDINSDLDDSDVDVIVDDEESHNNINEFDDDILDINEDNINLEENVDSNQLDNKDLSNEEEFIIQNDNKKINETVNNYDGKIDDEEDIISKYQKPLEKLDRGISIVDLEDNTTNLNKDETNITNDKNIQKSSSNKIDIEKDIELKDQNQIDETFDIEKEESIETDEIPIEETIDVVLDSIKNDEKDSIVENNVEEIYVDHEARSKIPDDVPDDDFDFNDIFNEKEDISILDDDSLFNDKEEINLEDEDISNEEDNKKERLGIWKSIVKDIKEGESKLEPKLDANGNIIYKTEIIKDEKVDINVENFEVEDVVIDINDNTSIIKQEKVNNDIIPENETSEKKDYSDSAYDEYIIKDDSDYYKGIKFKSSINLDGEKDMSEEKYTEEEIDYYENEDGYYKGAGDITNPLKKNNVYHNDRKEKRSIKNTFNEIKKEVNYLNNSIKEIENPTPPEYIHVIDRTQEYVPDDDFKDDSNIIIERENQKNQNKYDDYYIEPEINDLQDTVKEDNNYIEPEEVSSIKDDDFVLEDVIQDADKSYRKIEKERYRENNTLKSFDEQKLPQKMGEIKDYVIASDFGIESTKDLYDKPLDDVAGSIYEIVKVEGPIHYNEIVSRIKDSCEVKRAGSKFKNSISMAIDYGEEKGKILKIDNFLFDASNPEINIRKRNKPNIDLISDEEIAKNLEGILLEKTSMPIKQLTRNVARNFGFRSTSRKTSTRINQVIDKFIGEGKFVLNKDIVELK